MDAGSIGAVLAGLTALGAVGTLGGAIAQEAWPPIAGTG